MQKQKNLKNRKKRKYGRQKPVPNQRKPVRGGIRKPPLRTRKILKK